jgi:hypothetical protein
VGEASRSSGPVATVISLRPDHVKNVSEVPAQKNGPVSTQILAATRRCGRPRVSLLIKESDS